MTEVRDLIGDTDYGRLGYKKLGTVAQGFRFFSVERLGLPPRYSDAIKLTGAVYREAMSGVNKGLRTVRVIGTEVEVFITQAELDLFNLQNTGLRDVATLRVNKDGTHALFLSETNSLEEYMSLIRMIPVGEHKLFLVAPHKQPWPNHNWCVDCNPGNCSGCGTEPLERRKTHQDETFKNAQRYASWRDAMISEDPQFEAAMASALPQEVGRTRRPTKCEWDFAIDKAQEKKKGVPT